eukprot:CAMPEP_0168743416 /NCGR_PEP_ID=MMETSP0724-20121128/13565_1 /TAXON_ID=265536 /ORGANISM="Amphiprora sp., Strain CCMP467" /LENGTH=1154 /DNA_ID=CAMNT_0008791045 /DNA_START=91 /DNA_END=3556 /DNA_ORIENTATION=+
MNDDDSDFDDISEFSQEEEPSGRDSDTDDSGHPNNKKKKKSKSEEIGTKESKSVFRAKMMVYLVLIISCVTASTLTYFFTSDQEEDDFEDDFKTFADEISRVAKADLESKFVVAEGLSIATTSFAEEKGVAFPLVTMPDWERRTQKALEMTGADLIVMSPLVDFGMESEWLSYSQVESGWIHEGLEVQGLTHINPGAVPAFLHPVDNADGTVPDAPLLEKKVAPWWQTGKAPKNATWINTDFLTYGTYVELAEAVLQNKKGIISKIDEVAGLKLIVEDHHDDNGDHHAHGHDHSIGDDPPHSFILQPIYESFDSDAEVVGLLYIVVGWDVYFQGILPEGTNGVQIVLSDGCGSQYTFVLEGQVGRLMGEGDLHEGYDSLKVTSTLTGGDRVSQCEYILEIYATDELKESYESKDPLIFAIVVAMIFVFTTMVFLVYDWAVQRRQWMIIRAARKTQAIVSSLFPKNVQDRIMKDVDEEVNREANGPLITRGNRTKDQLQNFLKGKEATAEGGETAVDEGTKRSKPIADLFPEATIIFADIVGFTAWSSTREPSQVFQLLETIYHVFDEIANRRRVFKVETVGDCYVAVAGLPEPRKDHAIVMARFARDCLVQFTATVKAMVVELGPDTEELGVRIGLHSGPVTAGVLRGERARFQLFGDTVNTTARMESTGVPNKIHLSQETADLLVAAGKSQWLRTRREKVVAKGKGELQTYWLDSTGETATATTEGESDEEEKGAKPGIQTAPVVAPAPAVPSADKYNRLVAWNCDILAKLLTQIVARRESRRTDPDPVADIRKLEEQYGSNRYVLSEVQEIVRLPKFEADSQRVDPWSVQLSEEVLSQLKDYVQTLAAMYRDNPFHNFEHASHVTMSVSKLLSRIVAPEINKDLLGEGAIQEMILHDHTYGITSDPLTQFSVVLSALIHDVITEPNFLLVKEDESLAKKYISKSVAEQNSVDLAWKTLMLNEYGELRSCIFSDLTELRRFRALLINSVIATDIFDKEQGTMRKNRWAKAFSDEYKTTDRKDQHRRATIVIEHLIQASDVAHTMQHWHVYTKWNERLFQEMFESYLTGRSEKDPSAGWYQGELGFFDNYIIPLAKKLKNCGVFGVASDEYLNYAVENRREWADKGEEIVARMINKYGPNEGQFEDEMQQKLEI